ncbi:MAG: right-handed parallel beta-helix repeat-containing protein, partial [Kiritimatiellae bacterium]|nr:right-handed parallel beta-helix repeat-containing protein [Kiritimatiellia bacterium]
SDYLTVEDSRLWNTNIVNDEDGPWYEFFMWGGAITSCGDDNASGPAAHDIVIRRNEIFQNYGEGINMWGHNNGVIIEDNTFWDCWAPAIHFPNSENILISGNFLYHTNDAEFLREGEPGCGIAFINEVPPTKPGNIRDITVINNLVMGFNNSIAFWEDEIDGTIQNVLIAHNTFVDAHANTGESESIFILNTAIENIRIENNIILQEDNSAGLGYSVADNGISFSHNLWYPGTPPDNMQNDNDTLQNPLISRAGPTGAGLLTSDYFKIEANSPAIGAGKSLSEVTEDFANLARTTTPAIGAFEYNAGTPSYTYHVATNGSSSGDGSEGNPWNLQTANTNLQAGDIVLLHGGTYLGDDFIAPTNSGSSGSPIVYRAASGETPIVQGMTYGIYIPNNSYITIDGITVNNVYWWIYANNNASHLKFTNCTFTNAGAYAASWFMGGDDIHIADCNFSGGEDSIHMMATDHALIENNTFNGAVHECILLAGVQDSVVRGNYFSNPGQKCMEIVGTYDSEWSGPYRKSEHVVIEDNEFALAAGLPQSFSGIQYAGNSSIVRRNVFHDCGFGLDLTSWEDSDAQYNEHNRFYNNTFYKNGYLAEGVGIFFSHYDATAAYGDNLFTNNIIYQNKSTLTEGGNMTESVQVAFNWNPSPTDAGFYYNAFYYTTAEQKLFASLNLGAEYTLAEYEAAFPAHASDNIEANPKMVDPENGDFTLQGTSPCIDAGGALTNTTSSGSGTMIPVADALYFSDGKGLVGVDADIIRINGQQATIVNVDYANNEIEVSQSLSWGNNAPVTLDYNGSAPDMGAYEYASAPQ